MIGNAPSVKGGITSVIEQLIRHDWSSNSVDMKFISTYIEGGNVKKILYFILAYIKILFIMIFHRPDVVHIHMSYKGSFTRKYQIHKLCKKFEVRDVIHLHGSEFKKWYFSCKNEKRKEVKNLLQECDAFLVLGEKWNNVIKNIEPKTKTYVLSNTVNIPEEKSIWNRQKFQILFLGVLIERKGVSDLVHAIDYIKDSAIAGNVHFIIAGSGPEEEELKSLSKKLDIDSLITFAGWIDADKKKNLLKDSQMLVLPSYNEGLPVAILEAISYGLPIVATDVGDISSAVKDNVNGYLVQPGDIRGLANAMESIFVNQSIWEKMSKESSELAHEKFNEKYYFELLEKIWRDNI